MRKLKFTEAQGAFVLCQASETERPFLRLLKPQRESFTPTFAGALAAVWNMR